MFADVAWPASGTSCYRPPRLALKGRLHAPKWRSWGLGGSWGPDGRWYERRTKSRLVTPSPSIQSSPPRCSQLFLLPFLIPHHQHLDIRRMCFGMRKNMTETNTMTTTALTLPAVPPRKSQTLPPLPPHVPRHLTRPRRETLMTKPVYVRLNSTTTTSPTKTRPRRSMSSDSYGLDAVAITSGQKKAAEDKKGSRHADVVDAWDPTGLGSASESPFSFIEPIVAHASVWHHSGPYDAAAPSRNTNLPHSKAPMQAFHGQPITSPPRTGPTTISLSSPPPPVPGKSPAGEQPETGARPIKKGQTVMREKHTQSRRISGGGLTGQYSTSMPASGGYFPDMDAMEDEAAMARKERQRERESKRRALKAAWGIDTRGPPLQFQVLS